MLLICSCAVIHWWWNSILKCYTTFNPITTSLCKPVLKHMHYSSLKNTAVSQMRTEIYCKNKWELTHQVLSCGLTPAFMSAGVSMNTQRCVWGSVVDRYRWDATKILYCNEYLNLNGFSFTPYAPPSEWQWHQASLVGVRFITLRAHTRSFRTAFQKDYKKVHMHNTFQ